MAEKVEDIESVSYAIAFQSPESKLVESATYDPDTRVLEVTLKSGTYVYQGVSLARWREFLEADSKGGYFSGIIKSMYVGRKKL